MKKLILICFIILFGSAAYAQPNVGASREQIIAITSLWQGERFPDGRPKVADEWLERLRKVAIEPAWSVLCNRGYENQFEGSWTVLNPDGDIQMTGRVVTAQYMPFRPDMDTWVKAQGKAEGRANPPTNSWPIDVLQNGDFYVADSYGKVHDGPILGDNLANAIYAKSQRGVIVYGTARDPVGMRMIEGFNTWTKGFDASFLQQMMLTSINMPIRIGRATVLPGDVVLAAVHGVLFVPAHLIEEVVITAEVTEIRDRFGWARLREGKYTPGQIDSQWTEEIKKDFLEFIKTYDGDFVLPMNEEQFERYMTERNW